MRMCQKVFYPQKKTPPSLRATSFFPCLRGSTPKGGGSLKTPYFVYVCSFVTFVHKHYYQMKVSSFSRNSIHLIRRIST